MRKKLALGLALALTFSLAACNKPAAEPAETVVSEQLQTQDTPNTSAEALPLDESEPQELTEDELHELFEAEYLEFSEEVKNYPTMPEDIMIETEIWGLVDRCPSDKALPADYEAQYRAWRFNYTKETTNMDEGVTSDTLGGGNPDIMTNDGESYTGLGKDGQMGEPAEERNDVLESYGMTLREISKLPDDQKIALGFTKVAGAWVDSKGRTLPSPEISQEAHDSRVENIKDAGIILGSG